MSHVVLVTPDIVGARMAGPGIRAYHLARELAKRFATTLVAATDGESLESPFPILDCRSSEGRRAVAKAKILIGQPTRELLAVPPDGRKKIYDLFDPVVLELRELYGARPSLRESLHDRLEWSRLRYALTHGDLLISATDRQRDFYAGVHTASGGSISGWLARWISVPFGCESEDPSAGMENLGPDPVIAWSGGLWDWLDPETAIDAVIRLNSRGVACKLLVFAGRRPDRSVRASKRWQFIEAKASESNSVILHSEWVPYRERARWLNASRAVIILHRATLETEYSIRTRFFDAVWCKLPLVATEGGMVSDLIAQRKLGLIVPPEDAGAVAAAIERVIEDDAFHASSVYNLVQLRPELTWERVAAPLIEAVGRLQ